MLKIVCNHNKEDITHSFTIGQTFPDIKGKLLRIELNGNELMRLIKEREIPVCAIDNSYLIWYDRNAGHILKILREIWNL
jgi:hypothetical protein